ncbi:unnamed protein product [Caenorhabditis bovis]|uniref:Exportin-4 n=1 Tax=Caenorhabditis bovis TaxID=2654633 RepID=A0A8S1EYX8_9PELO|nr:unnamed protein product [Caenorhabditis bovis]
MIIFCLQSSNSFRPPSSWKDLLENNEFYILFFKLHAKIRQDEELCTKSMNCLIQLASLTGDCMPVNETEKSVRYVGLYLTNLLELFAQGPLPYEINLFCTIINRLFLYRPLTSIMKQENELRARFFIFLKEYTIHLTTQAMKKAIGDAEHDDHASLALIYDAITVLIRGRWRTSFEDADEADRIENELIKWPVLLIVNQFIQCVLAPPQGCRPLAKEEDDDGDDADDRVLFSDLLNPLGSMICYSVNEFLTNMTANLRKSLSEMTMIATGNGDVSRIAAWKEDQHWLMLIIATSVVGEEVDGACHIDGEVYDNTYHIFQTGVQYCPQKKIQYLQMCIEAPTSQNRAVFENEVDPFVRLMGELFAWSAVEHELFASGQVECVSPELCRSTFYALKRFLNAASSVSEYEKWNNYQGMSSEALPMLPNDDAFSRVLVRFVIKKVLAILVNYGSEERLCQDAIECLSGLVESRAPLIAASPELYEYLNNLDIAKLPNRADLMKVLVQIGAASNNSELQENMFKRILVPLAESFTELTKLESSTETDSQIVDLLQCFDGVAKASQAHSAGVLFKFLFSVINQCVALMRTRSHNETVVSTILQLLLDTTTKVSIYLDSEESNMLYATLLQIVDCYRTDQMKRFTGMTADDEDKGSDLVLFLDILSNVLSKDFLTLGEENVSTGAKVVITSLEMLLTIMNETILLMPEVALKFFRLILYLVEFSPEAIVEMSDGLISSLCQCMKLGMSGQFGTEIISTSLESLTEVVLHFAAADHKQKCTQQLAQQFKEMIPAVFETCLANTCDTSLYAESCSAVYSLIAFEKRFFEEYVSDLLSKKSNEAARHVLEEAFTQLLDAPMVTANRRGRIAFRAKMDSFLEKIQGLLSMFATVVTDQEEIEKAEALNLAAGLKYTIDHTWDGFPLTHDPIRLELKWKFERQNGRPHKRVVKITFDAPFFDDPEPMDPPGITPGLWDYEVMEFFFANERGQYLEVEVGPHGHWLCLLFDGVRHQINNGEDLELEVHNKWCGDRWIGEIEIPLAYFPARVSKFNAYHIHGAENERVYSALYPVTDGTHTVPDFHRLEFFQRINTRKLIPEGYGDRPFADFKYGDLWAGHY